MTTLLFDLRLMLHRKAVQIRADWSDYRARWEADTEPGYRMTRLDEDRCRLGLACADFLDALAGVR